MPDSKPTNPKDAYRIQVQVWDRNDDKHGKDEDRFYYQTGMQIPKELFGDNPYTKLCIDEIVKGFMKTTLAFHNNRPEPHKEESPN